MKQDPSDSAQEVIRIYSYLLRISEEQGVAGVAEYAANEINRLRQVIGRKNAALASFSSEISRWKDLASKKKG